MARAHRWIAAGAAVALVGALSCGGGHSAAGDASPETRADAGATVDGGGAAGRGAVADAGDAASDVAAPRPDADTSDATTEPADARADNHDGSGAAGTGAAPDASAPLAAAGCSVDGWCWRNPTPQGNPLRGVFALSKTRAWAVGDAGAIVEWDGAKWAPVAPVTEADLTGIWGRGEGELWIGGSGGVVLTRAGASWSVSNTGSTFPIQGVWSDGTTVSAVNRVGAVYQRPAADASASWRLAAQPVIGFSVTLFYADRAGHAVAAQTRVRSWTGTAWTAESGPELTGLTGDGTGRLWGWNTLDELQSFDGTTWAPVGNASAGTSVSRPALFALGPDDVWVAGSNARAYHWDGAVFENQGRLTPTTDLQADFHAAAGTGPDDVWAVGDGGTIMHWTGQAWSAAGSGSRANVNGVWAASASDAWAVGSFGVSLRGDASPWTASFGSIVSTKTDVYGTASDRVWGVDANAGLITWSAGDWTLVAPNQGGTYGHVWAAGDEVWVCGTNDNVARWNGTSLEPKPVGNVASCSAIWGSSGSDVWVGTSDGSGKVYRWDGAKWSPAMSLEVAKIRDLHGTGPNDVWAVGDNSDPVTPKPTLTAHWDGTRWTTFMIPSSTETLTAVWADAPGKAWAVGTHGFIARWNGQLWSPSQSGTHELLNGVASAGGRTYVVGAWGIVLAHD